MGCDCNEKNNINGNHSKDTQDRPKIIISHNYSNTSLCLNKLTRFCKSVYILQYYFIKAFSYLFLLTIYSLFIYIYIDIYI